MDFTDRGVGTFAAGRIRALVGVCVLLKYSLNVLVFFLKHKVSAFLASPTGRSLPCDHGLSCGEFETPQVGLCLSQPSLATPADVRKPETLGLMENSKAG